MFLTIKNPVSKDIFIHNNTILTSKEDKKSHGFGLLSINRVTKKYDGNLSLSCINKEFTISIDLCLL
jgi:two-component system sensor histidine kinase AgrC